MTISKHGSRCLMIHSLRSKAQSLLRARKYKAANEVLSRLKPLVTKQIGYEDRADRSGQATGHAVRSRHRGKIESERKRAA